MSRGLLEEDKLFPSTNTNKNAHKKKRLIPEPDSFFMDVKCPGCYQITTIFSHAKTTVVCSGCNTVLGKPTGGKLKLTEGCAFKVKDKE